jgi:hypothetical protein
VELTRSSREAKLQTKYGASLRSDNPLSPSVVEPNKTYFHKEHMSGLESSGFGKQVAIVVPKN